MERQDRAPEPHLSLSVPFSVVDQLVAAEVKRMPAQRLAMPDISGVSLGSVTMRVEKVKTRRAPPGRLGFQIQIGLRSGKQRVMGFDIDAVVTPRVDAEKREVVVALSGKNIQSIRPKLGKGSRKQLANFVWDQLPSAARMLTSKKQIASLVGGISEDLMEDAFRLVKRELLDDLGEITRIELDLPDMPLARVNLKTEAKFMVLDVHTTLPVERGLSSTAGRLPKMHPNVVQVRIPGATAAELGNYAMEMGEIPERWTLEGEPADDGPLYAGLAWQTGDKKPLALHLWSLEKDCAHVRLGATPQVSLERGELVLQTDDAKVEKVEGPLKVRAGIWFSGLGRRSFSFVERTAASVSFEVAGQDLTAHVHSARVEQDELVLGLRLGKKTPKRRK